eukprot:4278542-Amphidinium_carterae.1
MEDQACADTVDSTHHAPWATGEAAGTPPRTPRTLAFAAGQCGESVDSYVKVRSCCLSSRGIRTESFFMTVEIDIPEQYEDRTDAKVIPAVVLLQRNEEINLFSMPLPPCTQKEVTVSHKGLSIGSKIKFPTPQEVSETGVLIYSRQIRFVSSEAPFTLSFYNC